MRAGGWRAAKATLAVVAGITAALTTWVAVRRVGVGPAPAAVAVGGAFAGIPLAAYGTQVYPEMPAALAVMAALALLTAPRPTWATRLGALAATVALPWLAVKYVPVAAVLGVGLLWSVRRRRRTLVVVGGVAVLAGLRLPRRPPALVRRLDRLRHRRPLRRDRRVLGRRDAGRPRRSRPAPDRPRRRPRLRAGGVVAGVVPRPARPRDAGRPPVGRALAGGGRRDRRLAQRHVRGPDDARVVGARPPGRRRRARGRARPRRRGGTGPVAARDRRRPRSARGGELAVAGPASPRPAGGR